MSTAGLVTLTVITGFVWGGFVVALTFALQGERAKEGLPVGTSGGLVAWVLGLAVLSAVLLGLAANVLATGSLVPWVMAGGAAGAVFGFVLYRGVSAFYR